MTKRNVGVTAESVPVLKRVGHRIVRVPGSKSITARGIMLGSLGAGRTVLHKPLSCDDTDLLAQAMGQIGVGVKWSAKKLVMHGVDGKPPHGAKINLGAGGTPSRFMIAAGSLAAKPVTVDGDSRMRKRPVGELLTMLESLGVSFDSETLPVTVNGSELRGGSIDIPITKSSQFISALLLIAPFLENGLELKCKLPITSVPYVNLTIEMLRVFGVVVTDETKENERTLQVPQTRITHRELDIEPDASSAIYFAAIAAIHDEMTIKLDGLSLNSSQPDMEAIRLLSTIGAEVIEVEGGVEVTGTGTIRGFGDIDASGFPDASLCLAAIAAFGDSPSRIFGLETLPIKESDRVELMAKSLASVGCGVAASDSELRISPMNIGMQMPVAIDSMNDHRIAMAMAVIGTKRGGISIVEPSCVSKSYPTFWSDLRKVFEGKDDA